MKLSNGVKRLFWAWLAVLAILVAMLTTGCATTDYRILHTKGVPLCRHRTQAWLEKRQALGFEVARVYCVNRAFPVRSPGHVIGAARRPGVEEWTFIDTNTGEDVDWTIWRMVRMDLDISKPCPPWFRVDGKPMVFMTDTNRKDKVTS